jgi:hypothetical protein
MANGAVAVVVDNTISLDRALPLQPEEIPARSQSNLMLDDLRFSKGRVEGRAAPDDGLSGLHTGFQAPVAIFIVPPRMQSPLRGTI